MYGNILNIDFNNISTPLYIIDENLLENNLKILNYVMNKTGCKILLAQKAYSAYSTYPLIAKYLSGTTASSLNEARLGFEEMGKEVHIYSPAYIESDFKEIINICDHIVFNSLNQYKKYKKQIDDSGKNISSGIRINPEYSEIEIDIYNPCIPNSRFGIKPSQINIDDLDGIEGLHFHTLCQQDSDVLARVLKQIEEKFADLLYKVKWINFGGGHHITKEGYNLKLLIECINNIKNKYDLEVYLEPGEAIAYQAGFLVSSVIEILENNMNIAILDTSAACHMPDVIEMPYRPYIINSANAYKYKNTYRLAGPTCLAGDIIGDYSFKEELKPFDKLIFTDMAIYSMVKNNTFNGINLPSIGSINKKGDFKLIKSFNYYDFKSRL